MSGHRKPHIIRKNKKVEYPHYLIFFDTETPDENWHIHIGEQNLKLGVACYVRIDTSRNKIYKHWITFTKPEEFWDFVDKHHIAKTRLYIFAHNTRFDFAVTKGYTNLKRLDYEITFDTFESKPCIIRARKENKTLVILDTLNYFQTSIEKLGETFNIPKMKIPDGIKDFKRWEEYCRRDVEICMSAILRLIDMIKKEDLGGFGHTIAKQAFNAYRHRFMKYPITVHTFEDVIEIERKAYKGGRCEAFYIGKLDTPAIGFDINSAYPNVMLKYTYPIRYHHAERRISLNRLKELREKYLIIANIMFTLDKPAIGVKRDKLIFPIGRIHETLTTPEIELVMKYGEIKRIITVICYEHAPIFKEYVEYFYKKRLEAKKRKDNVMSLFYKIMLNSLYGKFGQKSEKWELICNDCGLPDGYYRCYDDITGEKYAERVINGVLWRKKGFVEGYDTVVSIAAFVTAYQRCELWKYMEKIPEKQLFYVDTDSLWIHPDAEKYLKVYTHEYELGMLKKEDERIEEIYGAKLYIKDGKRHFKGIKDDAEEIEEMTYKQIQFQQIKSAIRKGNPDSVVINEIIKKINRVYDKGNVTTDGYVKPIVLRDW